MLRSRYAPLCAVTLPTAERGRQFYMHAFDLSNPTVPEGFEDYLEPVRQLCKASGRKVGTAYLTVDEKLVKAGLTQRKPGPHVDGCFIPKYAGWEHGSWSHGSGWGHNPPSGYWGHGGGGWNHSCNLLPIPRMSVIVASNVSRCRVWEGDFDAEPASDGDLSHIREQLVYGEDVPANVGYILSPDCIHESLPMTEDTLRTFIRIALPVV